MAEIAPTRFQKSLIADRVEGFNAAPPSDDVIWGRRSWEPGRWFARTGIPFRALRRFLHRRGFRYDGQDTLVEAPCAGCRTRTPIQDLNSLRVCDSCGVGTPETTCRQERQGRGPRVELRRPYSPGVTRRPVTLRQSHIEVIE